MQSTDSLDALIQALKRLPGVGVKSAARMAFHLLQRDREGALALSQALAHAVDTMQHCTRCHTFTEGAVCAVFTAEGETTAHIISEALKSRGLRVTRLARGVPVGSELEYVDLGTIAHALADRR